MQNIISWTIFKINRNKGENRKNQLQKNGGISDNEPNINYNMIYRAISINIIKEYLGS